MKTISNWIIIISAVFPTIITTFLMGTSFKSPIECAFTMNSNSNSNNNNNNSSSSSITLNHFKIQLLLGSSTQAFKHKRNLHSWVTRHKCFSNSRNNNNNNNSNNNNNNSSSSNNNSSKISSEERSIVLCTFEILLLWTIDQTQLANNLRNTIKGSSRTNCCKNIY